MVAPGSFLGGGGGGGGVGVTVAGIHILDLNLNSTILKFKPYHLFN